MSPPQPAAGVPELEFVEASDLATAFAALSRTDLSTKVLAGGTDVMVQYLRRDIRPQVLVHVRAIPDLKHRSLGGRTVLGALTTHWELATDPELRSRHPALAEAAATVGGRQTQNVGTLAGNIVNASPAADLIPVLLVSDARVVLESRGGGREVALADFLVGRRATAIRPDELLTRVSLEPVRASVGEVYVKLGRRSAMEVAIVGLAVRLSFNEQGAIDDARIALGSVAPTAFRVKAAEERLVGTAAEAGVADAGSLLQAAARPIDDSRATAAYRSAVLPGLLARAVARCRERALAGTSRGA